MYTVLVKYVLPQPTPRGNMAERFKRSEEMFRNTPKLIRKYFCYDEAKHTGHSVYLWETEEAARAFYNDAFLEHFKANFGTTPELFFVDTLQVVDNEKEKTVFTEGDRVQ